MTDIPIPVFMFTSEDVRNVTMKKTIALLMIVLSVISMASCTEIASISETVNETNIVDDVTGSDIDETSDSKESTGETSDAGNAWEAILAEDNYISEQICRADGWCIDIDAAVKIDNVLAVNTYQYIITEFGDEGREQLFNCLYEESELEFDVIHVQKEVQQIDYWKLKYSDLVGDYYKFSVNYDFSGPGLNEEKIFLLSNHGVDLYPFEDNLLESVSDVGLPLDSALEQCEAFIGAIDPYNEYIVSHILPFGNNGRQQYYWIVYKKVIDGMQVTTFSDLKFLVDIKGVQEVGGAVYSLQVVENDVAILSLSEAIDILRNKVELISINDYEKYFTGSLPITKITFEYILGYDKSVIPCWRFYIGSSEDDRNRFGEYILAVDAVSGKIIQERRRHTF